ncbi:hypothetical protein B0T24DRAFT_640418 [Lasiosphaeria ovina]|uniref:Uncharacterized protein n=1 Tax=Lasiosphaeria ovina TaxID=92902 RepID=A0AAE0MYS8_9PEZI|nr:hypothetical protein B0T24DRAFT_640418 [Lasiosphaeria ovina]
MPPVSWRAPIAIASAIASVRTCHATLDTSLSCSSEPLPATYDTYGLLRGCWVGCTRPGPALFSQSAASPTDLPNVESSDLTGHLASPRLYGGRSLVR